MTVPVFTEKCCRHVGHRYGIVLCVLGATAEPLHDGHRTPCGHRALTNHRSAVASSGNIANTSMRVRPFR